MTPAQIGAVGIFFILGISIVIYALYGSDVKTTQTTTTTAVAAPAKIEAVSRLNTDTDLGNSHTKSFSTFPDKFMLESQYVPGFCMESDLHPSGMMPDKSFSKKKVRIRPCDETNGAQIWKWGPGESLRTLNTIEGGCIARWNNTASGDKWDWSDKYGPTDTFGSWTWLDDEDNCGKTDTQYYNEQRYKAVIDDAAKGIVKIKHANVGCLGIHHFTALLPSATPELKQGVSEAGTPTDGGVISHNPCTEAGKKGQWSNVDMGVLWKVHDSSKAKWKDGKNTGEQL